MLVSAILTQKKLHFCLIICFNVLPGIWYLVCVGINFFCIWVRFFRFRFRFRLFSLRVRCRGWRCNYVVALCFAWASDSGEGREGEDCGLNQL